MKVFVQGMRRSGTTVVFDVLCQEPRFDPWYEPFGPAKGGHRGGGSGLQDVEFAVRTRALREQLAGSRRDPAYYNYGAPRDAVLELESEWPPACLAYLRAILDSAPDTLVKFVRAADKLRALHELAPDAWLLHVVRDPRRVAVSQMLRRERAAAGLDPDRFFGRRDREGGLWASRALSEALLQRAEHADLTGLRDFERVLLVWRHLFRRTHEDGRTLFGDRYRLVRHEDLCARPREGVAGLFGFLGLEAPAAALDWASASLTRPPAPPLAEAPPWREAFARLKMEAEVRAAGYAEAVA